MRHVLIVGDSPAVCDDLVDALTHPRLRVVTTDSPARAFARLANDHVDFVIADSPLRLASGLDFLEAVRREFPGVSRVLLSSARDFASTREAIRRCDIAFLLPKPWDAASLGELIERLLLADRSGVGPPDEDVDAYPDPAVWGYPAEESNNDHLDPSAALRSSGSVEEE
ncbi:MAG: response regulator [Myxococcota bacterium]|nr:response regulator [Myxococcota bacterium]